MCDLELPKTYPWSGRNMRYTYMDHPPWTWAERYSDGTAELKGVLGGLHHHLMRALNMTYSVQKPIDGWYAMGFPNGTLKGMPRMLEDGLADITAGPQPRNAIYFEKLHFSPVVVESMLTMLSGMETAFVSRAQSFSGSFDNLTWLFLLVSFILATSVVVLHVLLVLKAPSQISKCSNYAVELFAMLVQEGVQFEFSAASARIMSGFWLMTSFILALSFAGQSRANLVVRAPTERLNTLEDFLKDDRLISMHLANTRLMDMITEIPGIGPRVKEQFEKTAVSYEVDQIFSEESKQLLASKKAVIFLDRFLLVTKVNAWCPTTKNFYYISTEDFGDLRSTFLVSRKLGHHLLQTMDLKVYWFYAMGLKFMKDRDLFKGHDDCVPSSRMEFPTQLTATTMLDLQSVFQTYAYSICISIGGFALEALWYNIFNQCTTMNERVAS